MISHKHKCIFIHIPKTAGMSIENSFAKSLGLDLVVGQCHPLLLTYNKDLKIGPQSLAHLSISDYVKHSYISEELFKEYFKFTFVRNPFDRILSIYRHFHYHRYITFETFLKHEFKFLEKERNYFIKPQIEYILNESGNIELDYLGNYENINSDFNEVSKKIEHPIAELKYINKSNTNVKRFSRGNLKFLRKTLKKKTHLIGKLSLDIKKNLILKEDMSDWSKEFIKDYYSADFKKLNYE